MIDLHSADSQTEIRVRIPVQAASNKVVASTVLEGNLTIPNNMNITNGIIVFAHGSGNGRRSPKNEYIAKALNKDGLATLLVDLLTKEEEQTDSRTERIRCKIPGLIMNKFNIRLLSDRLLKVTDWLLTTKQFETDKIIVGYFGVSTGAAAALMVAAQRANAVGAVVCQSGRPDLVSADLLTKVQAPTLFIVGGNDHKEVIDANNNTAKLLLNVQKKKVVVAPMANHPFEEQNALENLVRLASGWFRCYFLIKQHSNHDP
jgi:putative phosphoribosyl transferase